MRVLEPDSELYNTGIVDVSLGFDRALPVSGRTHHRLHDARDADLRDGHIEFLACIREFVTRRRESELFGSQAPDAFAIHRKERSLGRRDDVETFLFQWVGRPSSKRADYSDSI